MARMTKQQLRYLAAIAENRRTGKKIPRKDGSLATKPKVECPDIPEAKVLDQCIKWLNTRGILADRLNTGALPSPDGRRFNRYGIKGAGDIIACYNGLHIEIEAKRGKGGKLSLNQQMRKQKVEDAGGIYLITHGVPELELLWSEIVETSGYNKLKDKYTIEVNNDDN